MVIDDFPNEILFNIIKYLDFRSVIRLSETSKKMNMLVEQHLVDQHKVWDGYKRRDFNVKLDPPLDRKEVKKIYRINIETLHAQQLLMVLEKSGQLHMIQTVGLMSKHLSDPVQLLNDWHELKNNDDKISQLNEIKNAYKDIIFFYLTCVIDELSPLYSFLCLSVWGQYSELVNQLIPMFTPDKLNNTKFDNGMNILQISIYFGNSNVVKSILTNSKLDLTVTIHDDKLSLPMLAFIRKEMNICRILLQDPRIDINARNKYNHTLLMYAVKPGWVQLLRILLERPDLDINAQDNADCTALHHAVHLNAATSIELLLSHPKINTSLRSDLDSTAEMLAKEKGYLEVLQLLETHAEKQKQAKTWHLVRFSSTKVNTALIDIEETTAKANRKCSIM